jgi:crotonobetainyl-CoA:carnitine CoA-transferase CaiB-like acyl-CoA transferase
MSKPPHGPLQGVKVVSCSTAQAGTVPYMLMADLGADVIKIEPPDGGDGSRRMTVCRARAAPSSRPTIAA